jgi:glycosyltransferase involved in cell wall biosynthesis
MNSNTLLSIIVPIAKMSGKLQNLKNWLSMIKTEEIEVLLIHDHQDEKTKHELELVIAEFKFLDIVLIEGRWGNPGGPRNKGLELSKGEWVVFWDSDDTGNPINIFSALSKVQTKTEILIGRFDVYNNSTKELLHTNQKHYSLNSLANNLGIWRIAIKRNVAIKSKFPPLCIAEDIVFLVNLKLFDHTIEFADLNFYTYNINLMDQLTSRTNIGTELNFSTNLIHEYIAANKLNNLCSYYIILLNQIFSSIKHNNSINYKFVAFGKLLGKNRKELNLQIMFKSFLYVIRNRNERKYL